MAGETTLTIVGNLTADPELRFTNSGDAVAGFTIAHTARRYDKDTGRWVDGEALFMRCSVWRDLAEHVAETLTRGTRVLAVGRLRQTKWETREGETRTGFELTVDEIGPSLRWATARISKATRATAAEAPAQNDPWATPQGNTPAPMSGGSDSDAPPF